LPGSSRRAGTFIRHHRPGPDGPGGGARAGLPRAAASPAESHASKSGYFVEPGPSVSSPAPSCPMCDLLASGAPDRRSSQLGRPARRQRDKSRRPVSAWDGSEQIVLSCGNMGLKQGLRAGPGCGKGSRDRPPHVRFSYGRRQSAGVAPQSGSPALRTSSLPSQSDPTTRLALGS